MSGANLNTVNARGQTMLHQAVIEIKDSAKPILFSTIASAKGKFNFDAKDPLGHTVLWYAAAQRLDPDVVAALLLAGAPLNDPQRADIASALNTAVTNNPNRAESVAKIRKLLQM